MNDKNNDDRDFHIPPADYSGTFISPNGHGNIPRENPHHEPPQTISQSSPLPTPKKPVQSDNILFAESPQSQPNAILPPFPEVNNHPHRTLSEVTPIANQPPSMNPSPPYPEEAQTIPTYSPVSPPFQTTVSEPSIPISEQIPRQQSPQQPTFSEKSEKNEHSVGLFGNILSKFGFGHKRDIDNDDLLLLGLILLFSGNNDSSDNSDILLILALLLLLG